MSRTCGVLVPPTMARRTFVARASALAASAALTGCAMYEEKKVETRVFRNYSQKELDDAYDQSVWAQNAQEVIKRYTTKSEAVRKTYKPRTLKYGATAAETLDWFSTDRKNAPVQIFIHGGAWRLLTKDDSSAPAPTFVDSGAHYVALNFATIPAVRLPEMVEQCRRAIAWIYKNARSNGGDPNRLYVSGHSSGGHLSGVMLTTDWKAYGVPDTVLKGGICASGMFDLTPVMLSSRSSYVQIDEAEKHALSPIRHIDNIRCPIIVAYGDRESPEFKRQSMEFADAVKKAGKPCELILLQSTNHFEVIETMNSKDGVLGRAALRQMRLATA